MASFMLTPIGVHHGHAEERSTACRIALVNYIRRNVANRDHFRNPRIADFSHTSMRTFGTQQFWDGPHFYNWAIIISKSFNPRKVARIYKVSYYANHSMILIEITCIQV